MRALPEDPHPSGLIEGRKDIHIFRVATSLQYAPGDADNTNSMGLILGIVVPRPSSTLSNHPWAGCRSPEGWALRSATRAMDPDAAVTSRPDGRLLAATTCTEDTCSKPRATKAYHARAANTSVGLPLPTECLRNQAVNNIPWRVRLTTLIIPGHLKHEYRAIEVVLTVSSDLGPEDIRVFRAVDSACLHAVARVVGSCHESTP